MPPTNLDETYDPRPWRCDECRRVLGVVMRVITSGHGRGLTKLWVFYTDRLETDMPTLTVLRTAPSGLYKLHGVDQCDGVECSNCGTLTYWSKYSDSLLKLLRHYRKAPG